MSESNNPDKSLSVHNPRWMQIILYIAIFGFPICTLYLYYLSFNALSDPKDHNQYLYFGLATAITYISYIGLLYLKYVNCKLEFNDDQVSITKGFNTRVYKWSEITKVKNYPYSQLIILYHSTGKTIYIADHLTPGFQLFVNKLQQETGLTIN